MKHYIIFHWFADDLLAYKIQSHILKEDVKRLTLSHLNKTGYYFWTRKLSKLLRQCCHLNC